MQCAMVRTRLIDYLDGTLLSAEERAVRDHLSRCYLCVEAHEELRAVLGAVRDRLRMPQPVDGFAALRKHIRAEKKPRPVAPLVRKRRPRLLARLSAAAAIALITFMGASTLRAVARVAYSASEEIVLNERVELSRARTATAADAFVRASMLR